MPRSMPKSMASLFSEVMTGMCRWANYVLLHATERATIYLSTSRKRCRGRESLLAVGRYLRSKGVKPEGVYMAH